MTSNLNNAQYLPKFKARYDGISGLKQLSSTKKESLINDFKLVTADNTVYKGKKIVKCVGAGNTSNIPDSETILQFYVDTYDQYINTIWLKVVVKDATNTITTPLFLSRFIKNVKFINSSSNALEYSGATLYEHWNKHCNTEQNFAKLWKLGGGDALTITSAQTIFVPLYFPRTSCDFDDSANIEPYWDIRDIVDKKVEIQITTSTYANAFTVATNATIDTLKMELLVYYSLPQNNKQLTKSIYHKFFTEYNSSSQTMATTDTSLNLQSIVKLGVISEMFIIGQLTSDLAAGTLANFKTSTSVLTYVGLKIGSELIYEDDAPNYQNQLVDNLEYYGCEASFSGSTTLANNYRYSISFANSQNIKINGNYVTTTGLFVPVGQNFELILRFSDSQTRTVKVVALYDCMSYLSNNNKYAIEFVVPK